MKEGRRVTLFSRIEVKEIHETWHEKARASCLFLSSSSLQSRRRTYITNQSASSLTHQGFHRLHWHWSSSSVEKQNKRQRRFPGVRNRTASSKRHFPKIKLVWKSDFNKQSSRLLHAEFFLRDRRLSKSYTQRRTVCIKKGYQDEEHLNLTFSFQAWLPQERRKEVKKSLESIYPSFSTNWVWYRLPCPFFLKKFRRVSPTTKRDKFYFRLSFHPMKGRLIQFL
jgi:hypothetical protein